MSPRIVAAISAFLLLATVHAAHAAYPEVLIPWYNYPTWYDPPSYQWDDLAASTSQVAITAIINVSNGPGAGGPNADYQVGMAALATGGVTTIGYVFTSYGSRNINIVKADIDEWADNWVAHGISGIFLDEVTSGSADLDYYEALYLYALGKPGIDKVYGNPGTNADEGYFTRPAATLLVIFEDEATHWESYTPDSWVAGYPASRFSMLAHNAATAADMRAAIDLAVQRNIGFVYVTDDVLPNPWDTLPTYWQDELDYLEAQAVPGLPGTGLLWLGLALAATGRAAIRGRPSRGSR